MSIRAELGDWKDLAKWYSAFPTQAAGISAEALNSTAAKARDYAKQEAKDRFVLRAERWTLGSIRSSRTPRTMPLGRQFTLAGSVQQYMRSQELGADLPRTKQGRRITTSRGSREGAQARPRRKVARGAYRSKNVRIAPKLPRRRGETPLARTVAQVDHARRHGYKFVYMERVGSKNRRGIFDVRFKKIRMVHEFHDEKLRVPSTKWLNPAATRAASEMPGVWIRALAGSIDKKGPFG